MVFGVFWGDRCVYNADMAFDYNNIGTDTLEQGADRTYKGYNVGSIGLLLNIRLRFAIPGATPTPMKGLENEVYLPGDRVGTLGVPSWTQLKDEDLGNNVHRYTHGYATPGGNVLMRSMTKVTMAVDRISRTMYAGDHYTVIENASLSGTDIISNTARKGRVSGTAATQYDGAASPVLQDLKVVPAGANLQLTVNAESGDDIEVNLVFSAYNSLGINYNVDVRVLLAATEVCWCRHEHVAVGHDVTYCMSGRLDTLAAGAYTLKGQIYVPGEFNRIIQHYGTARCKLEYRLVRG